MTSFRLLKVYQEMNTNCGAQLSRIQQMEAAKISGDVSVTMNENNSVAHISATVKRKYFSYTD
jgi:hypothetical protein